LTLSTILIFDFGIVPTVWYNIFVFSFYYVTKQGKEEKRTIV